MTPEGPAAGAARILSPEDRIDLACDEFEGRWRAGPPPALEDFLLRYQQAEQRELFTELLLVDIEQRKVRHDPPTFDEYAERFPNYAAELQSIWLRLGIQETVVLTSTDTPVDRFRTGMRIAQFELVEKLGSGGAGEVWKAHDTRLQRTVAIKVPRQQRLSDADLRRFLREGQAAAQMRHSHLVPVHEVGHDGKTAFIVSDFIDGEDLRTWLRRRRPTAPEAAQLAADLAEALHHAHEHGVIHRDLKPANVLLDKQGQSHVTDFGLAKWAEDAQEMTVDGQILGTPAYMSPEQARGEAHRVDRRTDVFALGTMLYELLTSRRPFEGDQATVMHHIVRSEPTRPRSLDRKIPRDLETICLKALEKDPARRYPSAQEMAVDLRRYLRGEPILARRTSTLERGARWVRRRPALAASFVMAVVAIGSLALVRKFAEENRQLLGLRLVTLTTEPVGAKVTFVPLNEVTDEPMPDKMVHARTPSPVVEELRPGDYLVVAVLPDGRFHEVIRHVPSKEENLPGMYAHLKWRINGEDIEFLPVKIPDHSVTERMAFIEGTESETRLSRESSPPQKATQKIESFFVDFGEVTVGEWRQFRKSSPPNASTSPDSHAATPHYDEAVALAEKMGKRLPTVEEFEYVATRRRASRWPWGDEPPPDESPTEFGPVGAPAFDRLLDDPRIVGLRSNVAEWTSSSAARQKIDAQRAAPRKVLLPEVIIKHLQSSHWVVGGDQIVIEGNPTIAANHRAPAVRHSIRRGTVQPGLGFRCARSARPRDVPEAF